MHLSKLKPDPRFSIPDHRSNTSLNLYCTLQLLLVFNGFQIRYPDLTLPSHTSRYLCIPWHTLFNKISVLVPFSAEAPSGCYVRSCSNGFITYHKLSGIIGVWLSPVSGKHPAGAGMLETFVFLTVIGPFLPIMDCYWSNPINCVLSLDHTVSWTEQAVLRVFRGLTWAFYICIPFLLFITSFPLHWKYISSCLILDYWLLEKKSGFICTLSIIKECLDLCYEI